MKLLPFKSSRQSSIGMELEFQLIDPISFDLISKAKDFIRNIHESPYQNKIKPEITQSMIEINTSIHHSPTMIIGELADIQAFLLYQAKLAGVRISGGGTHPFQQWSLQKIFPTPRFKSKAHLYRYLSKRSTVFGLHIHVGCKTAEDALYLTHAIARFIPQLLALSASSPFYQGIDTGFASARSSVFNAFPLSGVIPYLTNWKAFSEYYYKMRKLKIIDSMKDFYWDIRPKPEFGTVEVRICDTPLTLNKAVIISAYLQTLADYLLTEKPDILSQDLYYLYSYNRFQASRYGLDGEFINPTDFKKISIADDILKTIERIQPYTKQLNNTQLISQIEFNAINKLNDANKIRQIYKDKPLFENLMRIQCEYWENHCDRG